MIELEKLIKKYDHLLKVEVIDQVEYKKERYPLYVLRLGSEKPLDPSIGFFGGVHGLEKIGSEVVISYLSTVLKTLEWDEMFQERLKRSRMVFFPIVNPVGVLNISRGNGNGVDLMRNSPLDGDEKSGPIYRGHRLSNKIPWYRGLEGAEMQTESKALIATAEKYLLSSKASLSVDVHSGFGAKDRLWFPFAHSRKPFPLLSEVHAFKTLFDETFPHHFYEIEPVSRQYTINGDLWDYVFINHLEKLKNEGRFFIPWTLEMGSWLWLKKNPAQIFTKFGAFHPMQPHRYHRILRRHLNMFDFFHRCLINFERWTNLKETEWHRHSRMAQDLWYPEGERK